ncbi:MAG: hypothetical protein Q7T80_01125 [Methanoregula sp.]|nr:hypothetical protein [Methanoregula sp.]
MKKIIGLFILVIVLAMISGCTQPAQPANTTTTVTTIVTTVVPTIPPTEATPVPTLEPTTVATPVSTTAIATTVTTVVKTPVPVGTASTRITTIYIRNNSFVPQQLTVLPGTGITWINEDETVHAIKIAGMFNYGDFVKGSQVDYTFGDKEGTFEIIDAYSNATCVIIVKKAPLLVGNPTVIPIITA